ncbi:glutamyl-tRNA reductase (plasmid) [Streptomyces sp. AHU1]|uniref:glutamyl-tRNA reductase n=1 Tax=Streptomyces sp. AHU1 TaxID=3377215 RepID=UPI003877C59C
MSLLVVGLSHRSAPVSMLEQTTLGLDDRPRVLQDMLAGDAATEAMMLATCNRIELYAAVDKFHGGVEEMAKQLSAHSGIGLDELAPHLYVHFEDRAVHHLFSVACGLDSLVVGEPHILGQVKDALAAGQELDTAGPLLNNLFQQALRVGKRAHSETGIDRAGQSLVTFGLEQLAADATVEKWAAGKQGLVIGAGSMCSLAATTLARAGIGQLTIANRTLKRAQQLAAVLAEQFGPGLTARAVPMAEVPFELGRVDLAVSCTSATGLTLTTADVAAAVAGRPTAPGAPSEANRVPAGSRGTLHLLDLAMPRDIDIAVHDIDGARLVDIETLAATAADTPAADDVDRVRSLVAAEVAAFGAAVRAERSVPTIVALRAMAEDLVTSELARLERRLPDLDERQRSETAQTVRRVVDKLLHAPTTRVKRLAGEPGGGEYTRVLRELFDLLPTA